MPFQLGALAGLLDFVPYVGPILSAIPGVMVGFAQSPEQALWTLGVYVLVQQVESQLIQPLVQRKVVDLPPVVTIAAIAAGGYLFGLVGALVATPLAICLMTLVNMLYVEDQLGEERRFPPPDKVPDEPAPAG